MFRDQQCVIRIARRKTGLRPVRQIGSQPVYTSISPIHDDYTEVFDKEKTLYLNSTTIALSYYVWPSGPSHTDGDASAYFVETEVFHTGDTSWNGHYPFIDYSTGGHIKGMIKAAETNLAKVTEKTIVIPGTARSAGNQK